MKIKSFQGEYMDEDLEEWRSNLNEYIDTEMPYHEYFTYFFSQVMERIEIILQDMKEAKEDPLYQALLERRREIEEQKASSVRKQRLKEKGLKPNKKHRNKKKSGGKKKSGRTTPRNLQGKEALEVPKELEKLVGGVSDQQFDLSKFGTLSEHENRES